MSTDRCARCHRVRPGGHGKDESAAKGLFPADLGWASFEDGDVCPDCQSPEEQLDAAQRVVGMITEEIERRDHEGIPPGPYEAPLVDYAMGAKEAHDDIAEREARSDSTGSSGRTHQTEPRGTDIAFTAAFHTGHPLAIRLRDYGLVQQKLGGHLRYPRWLVDGLSSQHGTYMGPQGGGLSEELPLVIARRDGADCLDRLTPRMGSLTSTRPHRHDAPVIEAEPLQLFVDIYDLGVGVLTAWFKVTRPAHTSLRALASAVNEIASLRPGGGSTLADELQSVAWATAREYGDAVAAAVPEHREAHWLPASPTESVESPTLPASSEAGRLLWLHPVYLLRGSGSSKNRLKELTPAFSERIAFEEGAFVAGIGSSAIEVSAERSQNETLLPIRLTQLHWAYYALYLEIDRELMKVLNETRWTRPRTLSRLEAESRAVFERYLRILNARSRLDSHLNALGGDELAVWESIAKVQRFGPLEGAVEHKVAGLEKVAQQRIDETRAERDRRIGRTLGFLAVLTIVTVAVGIIGVVAGAVEPNFGPAADRIRILFAASVIAVFVWWWIFFPTPWSWWRSRRGTKRP